MRNVRKANPRLVKASGKPVKAKAMPVVMPTPPVMLAPPYWDAAIAHLRNADPVMQRIIDAYPNEGLRNRGNGFETLVRSVVGQQISVKAADAVWNRLHTTLGGMTPPLLIDATEEILRGAGLSRSKAVYAKEVAKFFHERNIHPEYWSAMDDAAVLKELVSIKGIGKWTAEMFMIFHLMRPDVLPLGDLGIIKAINLLYGKPNKPLELKQIERIAKRWQPYRTVAMWYLWRSLDPIPVSY